MNKVGRVEVWVKPWGEIVTMQWNPCGCHPNEYTFRRGNKWSDAVSYMNAPRIKTLRSLKRYGWVKVGYL